MKKMIRKQLKVPRFKSEDKERIFWSKIDLSQYAEVKDFRRVSFPNLKPTSTAISLRLPNYIIIRLKEQANELHIPYQTLIKQYIAKGVLRK